MATGQQHDKATKICSLVFGVCIGIYLDIQTGVYGGIAFAIGGLWLSPDLDTESKPLKRWGIFKIIWFPYRKLIKHRSFISHSPIIGTLIRLIYLYVISTLIIELIDFLNPNVKLNINEIASNIISIYPKQLIVSVIGFELSTWLHLLQDN